MTHTIQNFTHSSHLRVKVQPASADMASLVIVSAFDGPFSLVHGMSPTQAREMAQALWDCAHEVDGK